MHTQIQIPSAEAFLAHASTLNPAPTHMVFPAPLSQERISWLVTKGVDAQIAALDLEMVKMKLRDKDEARAGRPSRPTKPSSSTSAGSPW